MGALLAELGAQGWYVIHDASFGNGNVDHIVIGPPGVFTVETKSHPGPVRVARVHGAVLAPGALPARAIERVTGEKVEPLLVYSRAWVDRPLARRRGVRVVPARMLVGHLLQLPRKLSSEEVERAHRRVATRARGAAPFESPRGGGTLARVALPEVGKEERAGRAGPRGDRGVGHACRGEFCAQRCDRGWL